MKKTAIRLVPDGRYFLEWHKFFHRQGDRAVFHATEKQVFLHGDELDRDIIISKLRGRGHIVRIVEVEWSNEKKNFVETVGGRIIDVKQGEEYERSQR